METAKEKTCENCRFYLQHYVKSSNGYTAIYCGHCVNDNFNARSKLSVRKNCEYWQPVELRKTEFKEKLINKLKILAKRLDAVCEVLIDDNN